jgi:hypothetical protein
VKSCSLATVIIARAIFAPPASAQYQAQHDAVKDLHCCYDQMKADSDAMANLDFKIALLEK